MCKGNYENTRARCKTCSKLTLKTPELRHPYHTETSQLICIANQLTGFYIWGALIVNGSIQGLRNQCFQEVDKADQRKWKQPSRRVLKKGCSENMQQIYGRTPMTKCDFNKVTITVWYGCSPVNLLHNFRTPFLKNIFGRLLVEKLVANRKTDELLNTEMYKHQLSEVALKLNHKRWFYNLLTKLCLIYLFTFAFHDFELYVLQQFRFRRGKYFKSRSQLYIKIPIPCLRTKRNP